jgi:hypothetical protein
VVRASGHQQVDASLDVESSLSGRLVDDDNAQPIVGAQVSLWPWAWSSGGPAHRGTITDEDGRFEVRGLGAGRFELKVWDQTHVMAQVEQVAIEPAQANGPLVLRLPRGVEVSGMVRDGGSPLAGKLVAVSVPDLPMAPRSHWYVTGNDGSFHIHAAPVAAHARIEVSGYDVTTAIDTGRGTVENVQVDVVPRPTLRGVVIFRGKPLSGALVDVRANKQAVTGGDGRFEIDLAPGTYDVGARSDALGARASTRASVVIPMTGSIALDLDADARISGAVLDAAGTPVVDVDVVAAGDEDTRTVKTGLAGVFEIDQLASRTITLSVRGLQWSGPPPPAIDLADSHARIGGVRLTVARPRSTLRGRVTDDRGEPVADASVGAGSSQTLTDELGRFAIDVVGDGPFTLHAASGSSLRARVEGVAPGTSGLVLPLRRLGALHGDVIGLPGAHVWVRLAGGPVAASYAPKLANDSFEVDALEPGSYIVDAVNDLGQRATAYATVADGVAKVSLVAPTAK